MNKTQKIQLLCDSLVNEGVDANVAETVRRINYSPAFESVYGFDENRLKFLHLESFGLNKFPLRNLKQLIIGPKAINDIPADLFTLCPNLENVIIHIFNTSDLPETLFNLKLPKTIYLGYQTTSMTKEGIIQKLKVNGIELDPTKVHLVRTK